MNRIALVLLLALAAGACAEKPAEPAKPAATKRPAAARPAAPAVSLGAPEDLPNPASAGAAEPFLEATPDGAILMSWIESSADGRAAVKMSRFDGSAWSAPSVIVEAGDLFVNWADFPSLHAFENGHLAAHWLQKSGNGKYAYDVRIARSTDGGATWSEPITPHEQETATEHGFVSFAHAPGSTDLQAIWLDGRLMLPEDEGHGGGEMTLRWARFSPDGLTLEEQELDRRTCECCQTAMTMTPLGAIVAYRDRSENEVRDIAVVRQTPGGWTPPAIVHADGWTIPGCPVNGPQLAAHGARAALAWFTAPKDEGIVNLAFSDDSGARWSAPVRVDQGNPLGRVDVVMPDGGRAVIAWMERAGEAAEIRARVVARDGTMGEPRVIGRSANSRSAGFPRVALAGDHLYFTWTDPADASQLRFSRVKVNE
ncbi:MAG TPA: sialidase family protein [Thermoanaerobaculia bacterium]|nr:sialidase family protein [Thermoanaerobaculia bacterium]